jgi:hypothetical protein
MKNERIKEGEKEKGKNLLPTQFRHTAVVIPAS